MSEKYRKHRASKYEFPTQPGESRSGESSAKSAIEHRLKRKLAAETVTRHTRSQWVFCEPREVA